jgi:hypothetical protein
MITEMPEWGKLTPLRNHVHAWAKSTTQRLRKTHWIEGLHWRYDHAGDVVFNLPLIRDWLATGGGEAHQRACEQFLSSLPSNQPTGRKASQNKAVAA